MSDNFPIWFNAIILQETFSTFLSHWAFSIIQQILGLKLSTLNIVFFIISQETRYMHYKVSKLLN